MRLFDHRSHLLGEISSVKQFHVNSCSMPYAGSSECFHELHSELVIVFPAFGTKTDKDFTAALVHRQVNLDELPLHLAFSIPDPNPLSVLVQRQTSRIDDHRQPFLTQAGDGLLQEFCKVRERNVLDVLLSSISIRDCFHQP